MNPRLDVFRKQNEHFIRWETTDRFEDVGRLVHADSDSTGAPEEEHLAGHLALGVTETLRLKALGSRVKSKASPFQR